jgi:small subunit ribosomal protein S8
MQLLSINYSIILNGLQKKFSYVLIHKSNLTLLFLDVLFREGVIRSYALLPTGKVKVFLKYYKGIPLIKNIKAVSTSGNLVYYNLEDICCWKKTYSPLNSFLILNTSKQMFSSNEIKNYKIGGQVLCLIN